MKLSKPEPLGGSWPLRTLVVESGFAAYAQCSADDRRSGVRLTAGCMSIVLALALQVTADTSQHCTLEAGALEAAVRYVVARYPAMCPRQKPCWLTVAGSAPQGSLIIRLRGLRQVRPYFGDELLVARHDVFLDIASVQDEPTGGCGVGAALGMPELGGWHCRVIVARTRSGWTTSASKSLCKSWSLE